MRYFFTAVLLMLGFCCQAQTVEIGYAPVSVTAWGNLPKTTKYSVGVITEVYRSGIFSYKPGARYTYINSKSNAIDEVGDKVKGTFNMIFAMPASFNIDAGPLSIVNRFGAGVSNESFPNENGLQLNFLLETGIGYAISRHVRLSLRYSHISNGYRGRTNPGVDNIVLGTGILF